MKSVLSILSTLFSSVRALGFRWFKGRFLGNKFTIKNPPNSIENWFSNASKVFLLPKVTIMAETQFLSRCSPKTNIKDNDLPSNSENLQQDLSKKCLFTRSDNSDWIQIDRSTTVFSHTLEFPKFISRKPWFAQNPPNHRFQELSDLSQNKHIRHLELLAKFCMNECAQIGLFWTNWSSRDIQTLYIDDFTWWNENSAQILRMESAV